MILVSLLFYSYIICILFFVIGFGKVQEFKRTITSEKTTFSVIIPFRNEAKNLPKLLESIGHLVYSKYLIEFIFVDDNSSDNSVQIIERFFAENQNNIQVIKNKRISNSPKKDAITTAIKATKKNWIITTDADCILPNNWLKTIDAFIQQNNCNMIIAPVSYSCNTSFLHQFQRLDFMSLQASTIGGFGLKVPFLANGANFIYKKDVFEKVKGFDGNTSIASGDDVFLLEKFIHFNKQKVQYLKSKDAIVQTFPVNYFYELIQQRIRWASKTANYKLVIGKLIGVIVLAGNTILAISPLLVLLNIMWIKTVVAFFLLKLFFDYLLLKRMAIFESKKIVFLDYLKSSIVYPYFTLLIVIKSLFSKYQWKERTFKK